MATYVNDLRLKEIATGDEAGTWGNSTNTNLELIGEALGFGTEAITTNADTHTTTVADGATDPGRAMYLKYTGTLDSACTITIAPNTISRMQFIENGTSGSQNIIISQGTGANVTIPAGDVKAVYLDGAGSGAAVADAFASLNTVDLKVEDDLTVTDDVSIGGALTLTGNGDFNGDLDVDGTTNLDVVDIDGAVDMASTLQVDGAITSSAGATITTADNTDTLSLVSTDADANAGPNLRMYRNSGSPADSDAIGLIDFEGRNDNSQDVVYAAIDTRIVDASDGTEDGRIEFATILAGTAGVSRVLMDATETVFNDNSKDLDFRIESDGNANMFFVDGGNDNVGIGMQPTGVLDVKSDGGDDSINLVHSGNTVNLVSIGQSSDNSGNGVIQLRRNNGTVHSQIHSHGNSYFNGGSIGVGFSSGTPSSKLHVDSSFSGTLVTFHNTAGASSSDRGLDVETSTTGTTVQRWINSGSELGRFTATGNLVVGSTVAPQGTGLVVNSKISSSSTTAIEIQQATTGANKAAAAFGVAIGNGGESTNASDLTFLAATGGSLTERMRITTGGTICIGTTSSSGTSAMDIRQVNNQVIRSESTGSGSVVHVQFVKTSGGTAQIGDITGTTSSISYNSSSDYRLKENVITDWDATTLLKQLKPSKFNFKDNQSETVTGFIAHEVQEVLPYLVSGEKDGENMQTMDYAKLTPLLTKAIQEQQEQIEQLKTEIKTLQ